MGTNSLIKFAVLNADQLPDYDTLTDSELVSLVGTVGDDGIVYGSIAKTDILNGLFRQLTYTNKVLGDLVAEHSGEDVNTGVVDSTFQTNMETAIGVVAKNAVTDDLDSILGVNSDVGLVKRTGTDTYIIDTTSYVPNYRTIAGLTLSADRSRDSIIGINQNGFVKRIGSNSYIHDNTTYAPLSDVALKQSGSPMDPTFWVGDQNAYNLLTPDDDVIYFITE